MTILKRSVDGELIYPVNGKDLYEAVTVVLIQLPLISVKQRIMRCAHNQDNVYQKYITTEGRQNRYSNITV